jgi:hypothetical protein
VDIENEIEKRIRKILEYKTGEASLLRLITIPVGVSLACMGFFVGGLVEELSDLKRDFEKAKQERSS